MKRHGRPIFGITKRTRFAAAMVVVAAVLVMAVIVLGYVGIFGLRSELFEVAVTTDEAGDSFGGVGINCDVIPNINLVRDASFESSTDYSSLLVAGASESSVYLTPDAVTAAGYDTSNCAGDSARIISIDSEGVMSEKFTGSITGFKPARLGVVTLIKDSKNIWDEDRLETMTFYGNTALALTEDGRLISDATNSQLTAIVDINEKIAWIDSNDSGVIAASISGSIYTSADGKNFNLVYQSEGSGTKVVCGIGSTDSTLAVCYSDGTIVSVTNGKVATSNLPSTNAIALVSDGDKFLASDGDGNLYSSSNGMVFEKVGNVELLNGATKPLVCASAGIYCFVVDNTQAAVVEMDETGLFIKEIDIANVTGSEVVNAELTDSGLIIVATKDKKAFAINLLTGDTAALTSENTIIENIIGVSGDKVYYDSGKDIYKSQILSELSVDGSLEGIDVIADDILIIGHAQAAAVGAVDVTEDNSCVWDISEDSVWDVYGSGTYVITTDRAYSGRYGARVIGRGIGVHAMTQTLPGNAEDNFIPGTFYRLSLYAMSDDAPDKVYCWLEGADFGRMGLELTQIGNNYKYYSYVFAVTDYMTGSSEITLNIAFEGNGNIFVDDIYLGPDSYESAGVPQFYADTLASGHPSAIRLNNLNIGSSGFAQDSLYLMSADSVSCDITDMSSVTEYGDGENTDLPASYVQSPTTSLEDSLKLVKQCNSSPWLVIGPYVNQDDIDRLLEYMCGSLTSEYGGRRIDNGTALPWSRQFSRFYIEINDSGNVFTSDIQKASYVNYVISMFSQSEYFSDIKDKTIFLDGMTYDSGTMMSDADNHTMSISLVANDSSATYIDNIDTNYILARYNSPHVVSGSNGGEYIYDLDTSGSNCARIITAIVTKEADFAEMFLFDAAVNFVPSKYTGSEMFVGNKEFINMMTVSGLVSDFTGFDELYIDLKEPLDESVTISPEQFSSNVVTACFNKGPRTYIIIANASNSQQSFLINDNALGRTDTTIRRYDESGRLINEKTLRYEHTRNILQPGEFIIVDIKGRG